VLVLAVESLAIWPHYLAFFNGFVGGPDKGPEYLVDSNLDWGQELSNLKKYVARTRSRDSASATSATPAWITTSSTTCTCPGPTRPTSEPRWTVSRR